jgi:hypothetical protein
METRISSRTILIYKWVLPVAWIAFILPIALGAWGDQSAPGGPMFIVVPILMLLFGVFFYKILVWDLADVVYDYGSYLLLRRLGTEVQVPLQNIMNVSSTTMLSPPRITLRLLKPCALGTHVSFSPKSSPLSLRFSHTSTIAEQLIERAFAPRSQSAG